MKTNSEIFFPPFRLDVTAERLWHEQREIPLRPKTFAILRYLVENSGRLVKKEDLLHAVWGDTQVSEDGLRDYLREIRQALGDDASAPRFVETVRGRGYRFLPVIRTQPVPSSGFQGPSEQAKETDPRRGTWNFERGTSLVGREPEIAKLQQWLEKAAHGERQLVFVTGEPGIGKTAVVEAFLAGLGQQVTGNGEQENQKAKVKEQKAKRETDPQSLTLDSWLAHGQCIEAHGAGEAFLPILDALGRLCWGPQGELILDVLRRHAPMWLVQLPALVESEELEVLQRKVQGAARERMLREIAEALEVLTAETPLLLVLEDLHWSDVSTLDLLAFLARRKEPACLLVISTYRPAEMLNEEHPLKGVVQELSAHGWAEELSLGLLSEADIATYLQKRLNVAGNGRDDEGCHSEPQRSAGEESHDTRDSTRDSSASGLRMTTLGADGGRSFLRSFPQMLHHRTGGNPLFLVSLVNDLIERGALVQTDTGWELNEEASVLGSTVPDSIRHLVARQSGRLSLEERSTLEAASVAGMKFSAAAVAAALATDTTIVERHCEHLAERQQFLKRLGVEEWPDGTLAAHYTFLHALYQQLWHERVTPTQLQHYHLHIGERKERAYGNRAREIAAELAVHFEQGREYQRAVLYLQLVGENGVRRSAYGEAVNHFTKGLELLKTLPDTSERAQKELLLQMPLGSALMAAKGYATSEVENTYSRVRELCGRVGETPGLIWALLGLQVFYTTRGELQMGYELAEQAIRLAQKGQDPFLLMRSYSALGEALFWIGELASAQEYTERAIAFDDRRPRSSWEWAAPKSTFLSYTVLTLWMLGYPDQALRRSQEALALAQEIAHPFSLVWVLHFATWLHQCRQDALATQEQAERLIALCTEQGFPFWLTPGRRFRGWALTEQGWEEEGLTQMRQGQATRPGTSVKPRVGRSHSLALLAEMRGKVGQPAEGLNVLVEAFAAVNKTGERYYEAELYRLKGELTLQAKVESEKWKEGSRAAKIPNPQLRSPSPQVEAEAEVCFLKAIQIAKKQQAKMWELRATVSLARLWQRQGKKNEARTMLAEIYDWFTEGFDTVDVKEAKGLLEELSH